MGVVTGKEAGGQGRQLEGVSPARLLLGPRNSGKQVPGPTWSRSGKAQEWEAWVRSWRPGLEQGPRLPQASAQLRQGAATPRGASARALEPGPPTPPHQTPTEEPLSPPALRTHRPSLQGEVEKCLKEGTFTQKKQSNLQLTHIRTTHPNINFE